MTTGTADALALQHVAVAGPVVARSAQVGQDEGPLEPTVLAVVAGLEGGPAVQSHVVVDDRQVAGQQPYGAGRFVEDQGQLGECRTG